MPLPLSDMFQPDGIYTSLPGHPVVVVQPDQEQILCNAAKQTMILTISQHKSVPVRTIQHKMFTIPCIICFFKCRIIIDHLFHGNPVPVISSVPVIKSVLISIHNPDVFLGITGWPHPGLTSSIHFKRPYSHPGVSDIPLAPSGVFIIPACPKCRS